MQHKTPTLSLVAYWVRMAIGSGEYFLVDLENSKKNLLASFAALDDSMGDVLSNFEEGRMRAE